MRAIAIDPDGTVTTVELPDGREEWHRHGSEYVSGCEAIDAVGTALGVDPATVVTATLPLTDPPVAVLYGLDLIAMVAAYAVGVEIRTMAPNRPAGELAERLSAPGVLMGEEITGRALFVGTAAGRMAPIPDAYAATILRMAGGTLADAAGGILEDLARATGVDADGRVY